MNSLSLSFNLNFEDLYTREGIAQVDSVFLEWLDVADSALGASFKDARSQPGALSKKEFSKLILEVAPHLDDFIAELFGITPQVITLAEQHQRLAPIYTCKRIFVQRRALKKYAKESASVDPSSLRSALNDFIGDTPDGESGELSFAKKVNSWMQEESVFSSELEVAGKYAAWAVLSSEGKDRHKDGVLFHTPSKIFPENLLTIDQIPISNTGGKVTSWTLPENKLRQRDGFSLTDVGFDLNHALDEAHYCIFCHNQGKDSCSHGLREKSVNTDKPGKFQKSHFGVTLAGCPLEERISEMHSAKVVGQSIAALSIATIDNPMVAATGHRICNDCMKACIYQKQEPVDIPQVETRVLKDVLELPWGFEIYSLLTRWVPFDFERPIPRSKSNKRVLIAGMGPAGFTLAHHLMNDGHLVVGVDGLKIEPLPSDLNGVTDNGSRVPFRPLRDVSELYESLDERVMAGFGGVAEYGITVRWDKNFLKIIRLLLERRLEFSLLGAVRFGGALNIDQAFDQGFDHVALAMGAGRPTVLPLPNGLARGVRTASDFLMGLQLTGAARKDSIANMQLRLPVVVVGGGLTAIDTATESMAYYPIQVEKFLTRYEKIVSEHGEEHAKDGWTDEDSIIAEEFISHARAIRQERLDAQSEKREPKIRQLLQGWGGVTIAYRKRLIDSPSYTLNHEEVGKAFEEGIFFAEGLAPSSIEIDKYGHAESISLVRQRRTRDEREGNWITTDTVESLRARSILIAAGTQPNTVLSREDGSVEIDGRYFQAIDLDGSAISPERVRKPDDVNILTALREDGRAVSFFGDLHPSFAGNVVGAMASAKQGYPIVSRLLAQLDQRFEKSDEEFLTFLNDRYIAKIHEVNRLTPTIIEVIVKAKAAAEAFRPGQFYRLQNFETLAPRTHDTTLAMEGLAMTGAWVDRQEGLVSTIILEMGGSSDICALLKPGEPIVLMGPTGEPTKTPGNETVMLIGGGLGNAVLFSIGKALRNEGSRVLYFAGYRDRKDRYKVKDIEEASDVTVWAVDKGSPFEIGRSSDFTFSGNIVDAIIAYSNGDLGTQDIKVQDVDRIITIGSDRMMSAVKEARLSVLKAILNPKHIAIGSINSPMQCMMKEICAQCLQPQKDPITGERTMVFSCFCQDQDLDMVDFEALNQRLRQNSLQEKLTKHWINHCLVKLGHRTV